MSGKRHDNNNCFSNRKMPSYPTPHLPKIVILMQISLTRSKTNDSSPTPNWRQTPRHKVSLSIVVFFLNQIHRNSFLSPRLLVKSGAPLSMKRKHETSKKMNMIGLAALAWVRHKLKSQKITRKHRTRVIWCNLCACCPTASGWPPLL